MNYLVDHPAVVILGGVAIGIVLIIIIESVKRLIK